MHLLGFIIIGLIAGWLAGKLMKGKGFGAIGDIIVGVIGALIGGFLFRTLGISTDGGLIGSLIVATIGAVVLLYLLRLFKKTSNTSAVGVDANDSRNWWETFIIASYPSDSQYHAFG